MQFKGRKFDLQKTRPVIETENVFCPLINFNGKNMLKIKKVKKVIGMITIFAFIATLFPAFVLTSSAKDKKGDETVLLTETETETEAITSNDMLHFKVKVRWGNVIGDPTTITQANFKGSVSVDDASRVSLENTLRFENHTADADKITDKTDTKISWNSLIYNDWDGVMATVSAPANSYVTIDTSLDSASGYATGSTYQIKKTAQELYSSSDEIIQDVGSGREVVVKSYKVSKHPSYFLKIYWGKIERSGYSDECVPGQARKGTCTTPLLNAQGSFKIDSGGKLKLMKTLRFEAGDSITSKSDTEVKWNSVLYGGIDGILVDLKLNADELDSSDTVTINFDKHAAAGFPKSYSIVDLYHNGITKDVITSDGYGVAFQVWKRPNKAVIKVKGKPTVYVIEDGIKMPIQSPTVLASNGLSFGDVEEVDQEEADTYANGEALNYADGTMVREENKPEVYVIANGEKKHILDPIAFADLGYNWGNVIVVPANSLGIFKKATAMNSNSTHPEGALIRVEGTPTVYVVEGGKRIPISDIQLFNARKYDWNKVLVVKNNQVAKFSVSTQLTYPDGSLIRDKGGKVYVVDHGKKRWIRSAEDLTKGGYEKEKILDIDNTASDQLSEGEDVVADDITE